MLPTGFRTFHFVSFLYVLFFSFLFLLFRFFSHYFVFVFLRFVFFRFFFVTFLLVFFSFFFLSVSFRFFSFFTVSQFTGTLIFQHYWNLLEDQDAATSELERISQWKPSMHSKFWPVEHPFLVSINNYIIDQKWSH